jgi:predicted permease
MLHSLAGDMRQAVRGLVRRPGYALVALATLALGIAANSAVFTLVNALLLRPLPLGEHGERVVTLYATHPTQPEDWEDSPLSYDDLADVADASRTLESAGGYLGRSFTVLAGGEAERLRGGSVTTNLFPLLGLHPALGRLFHADEGSDVGHESVVLLSHRLWQRRFGADSNVLGQSLVLNGRALTVVGVMPAGIRFPERDELWVPYAPGATERRNGRAPRALTGFGLLRRGARLAAAQAELDGIASRLAERHPDSHRGWGIRAASFRDSVVDRGTRAAALSLLAAVGAVLLVGCANLANLVLARGVAQRRELALRVALGAGRRQVVARVLAETLLLCAAGCALGLLLGAWGVRLMAASWPEELPYWLVTTPDVRVLAFTALAGTLAALVSGVLPALRAAQPDLAAVLHDGARGSAGPRHRRLSSALVVGQIALCLALLSGAQLMVQSFLRLQRAPSGFAEDALLSLRFYVAGEVYDRVEARAQLLRSLEERLAEQPGIASAAAASSIPVDDGGHPVPLAIDGRPAAKGEEPSAIMIVATPSLFETLGAPLLEGRGFDAAEHAAPRAEVAVVNRRLARRFFPQGALGRRVGIVEGDATRWLRIVGIAPDLQFEEFGEETAQSRYNVFVPYAARPYRSMALFVRTRTEPRAQKDAVRRVLREVEPSLATWDVRTMEEVRAATTFEQRFFGQLMGAFAAVALLLASLGVYGVLAHAVGRRTRELGVRLALGARPFDVVRLVLSEGAALGALGIVLGLALAPAVAAALSGVLYGVEPLEPAALALLSATLLAVVVAASVLPARRAAAVDPSLSLRAD